MTFVSGRSLNSLVGIPFGFWLVSFCCWTHVITFLINAFHISVVDCMLNMILHILHISKFYWIINIILCILQMYNIFLKFVIPNRIEIIINLLLPY